MRINNNMLAANTNRQLGITGNNQSKSMEKLSSGLKINRAGDDAAGLSISEKMRGQIRGLDMASKNAQDSISLIQTAEGALSETHAILQRMRELSVQASNDTNVEDDRDAMQQELDQLLEEIDRIGNDTEFNTQKLLNGDRKTTGSGANMTGGLKFHIGANSNQAITLGIKSMKTDAIGSEAKAAVTSGASGTAGSPAVAAKTIGSLKETGISTQSGADEAITVINDAIKAVSSERSNLGSFQNRLEHTIKNLDNSSENLQTAESRIRDVDMAKEMVTLSKNNILQQAAQSMLAQANSKPEGVLQLLR